MKFLFICLLTVFYFVGYAQPNSRTVPVILDTDIGPDYDDVGAVAVLNALADRGEVIPLAIVASNKNMLVAPTIDLLNIYFGRPGLPVGAPKGKAPDIGAW